MALPNTWVQTDHETITSDIDLGTTYTSIGQYIESKSIPTGRVYWGDDATSTHRNYMYDWEFGYAGQNGYYKRTFSKTNAPVIKAQTLANNPYLEFDGTDYTSNLGSYTQAATSVSFKVNKGVLYYFDMWDQMGGTLEVSLRTGRYIQDGNVYIGVYDSVSDTMIYSALVGEVAVITATNIGTGTGSISYDTSIPLAVSDTLAITVSPDSSNDVLYKWYWNSTDITASGYGSTQTVSIILEATNNIELNFVDITQAIQPDNLQFNVQIYRGSAWTFDADNDTYVQDWTFNIPRLIEDWADDPRAVEYTYPHDSWKAMVINGSEPDYEGHIADYTGLGTLFTDDSFGNFAFNNITNLIRKYTNDYLKIVFENGKYISIGGYYSDFGQTRWYYADDTYIAGPDYMLSSYGTGTNQQWLPLFDGFWGGLPTKDSTIRMLGIAPGGTTKNYGIVYDTINTAKLAQIAQEWLGDQQSQVSGSITINSYRSEFIPLTAKLQRIIEIDGIEIYLDDKSITLDTITTESMSVDAGANYRLVMQGVSKAVETDSNGTAIAIRNLPYIFTATASNRYFRPYYYNPYDPDPADLISDTIDNTLVNNYMRYGDSDMMTILIPTEAQLQSMASQLYGSNFFTWLQSLGLNIMGVQDSLMSLAVAPFTIQSAGTKYINAAWISSSLQSNYANTNYKEIDCGSLTVSPLYNNFLDYTAQVQIYLPFIGYQSLDTEDVMNKTLHVMYRCDLATGDIICQILVDGSVMYQFSGNCYYSLPINSANYSDVIQKTISGATMIGVGVSGLNAGMTTLSHAQYLSEWFGDQLMEPSEIKGAQQEVKKGAKAIAGGAGNIGDIRFGGSSRSGALSGNLGLLGINKPYLIIKRPRIELPNNYAHYNGLPCNRYLSLSSLSGYTQMENIHLEGIPCLENELAEINQWLRGGVIL